MQRVLSVQSHVVRGRCGNAAAALPLELLGFDVDRLNTVQFSNHTGYGAWTGAALDCTQVKDLVSGLRDRKWLRKGQYDLILSGYMRDGEIVRVISDLVEETGAKWICDPVLGDYPRGLYVPEELIEVHRDISMKSAAIITPNQFEAECLTGIKITDEKSAWECIEELHKLGPRQICITSTLLTDPGDKFMIGLLSDLTGNEPIQGKMKIPIIRDDRCITKENPNGTVLFTGTGDMFAACLSGHSQSMQFHKAVGCALSALKSTLDTTLSLQKGKTVLNREDIEINIVSARRAIMDSGNADWSKFIEIKS